MSISNTSLLDANNYEKHQKLLLEFVHDMYLMTDTKQTAHLSVVSNKLHKSWEQTDHTKSLNLWTQVNSVVRAMTGKNLDSHEDLVELVQWAFHVRKLLAVATDGMEDKFDNIGMWSEKEDEERWNDDY